MGSLIRSTGFTRIGSRLCRGMQDFWKGSMLDPLASGAEMKAQHSQVGDAWPSALLKLKSFDDLQKLWFVCLKEKNLILTERQFSRSYKLQEWPGYPRYYKVRVTMKRILLVLSRRAIDEQCVRAKEILQKQTERDALETRRFHLEEAILKLKHKIQTMTSDSLSGALWQQTLFKYQRDHALILQDLEPLRKDATQLLSPDWQLTRKYSDLPGVMRWQRHWVRALQERPIQLVKKH